MHSRLFIAVGATRATQSAGFVDNSKNTEYHRIFPFDCNDLPKIKMAADSEKCRAFCWRHKKQLCNDVNPKLPSSNMSETTGGSGVASESDR